MKAVVFEVMICFSLLSLYVWNLLQYSLIALLMSTLPLAVSLFMILAIGIFSFLLSFLHLSFIHLFREPAVCFIHFVLLFLILLIFLGLMRIQTMAYLFAINSHSFFLSENFFFFPIVPVFLKDIPIDTEFWFGSSFFPTVEISSHFFLAL